MDDTSLPEDVFFCTEMTPWCPGLTDKGVKVVHTEAETLPRRWLTWGRFAQEKRCLVCGTMWVVK